VIAAAVCVDFPMPRYLVSDRKGRLRDPPLAEGQPGSFRHLFECQRQRSPQLGARHKAPRQPRLGGRGAPQAVHLVTPSCPFANLPETKRSRFGDELNAEKMKKAVSLRPEAVAQIEFLEWTEGNKLRHSKFVALREDKNPRSVVKEQAGEP
jgi:ATP dependent DNA ligase C terminal region